jgi:hypothetical protein
MPWIEPLSFPSRNSFPFNPGIPDRQLWAIGMVAAQWAMVEMQMHSHMQRFTKDDPGLAAEYARQQTFKHQRRFWQAQIEAKCEGSRLAILLGITERIKVLKGQRDRVMHGIWGGGMQAGTWASEDHETSDAKIQGMHPRTPPAWRLDFQGIRKIGRDIACLNISMFEALDPSIQPY